MSAVSVSEPDVRPILAEAVDVARRALLELQPEGVGEHLGVTVEDEYAATHHFATTLPGYRGWQWAVVVAAPPEAERATVSESALLPGPDALVAPDFVPWDQRVRPGDLAPGDLLAPLQDDPRLVPGYLATGDPVVDEVCEELGQGRPQVLSREGRAEAAERWFTEYGPDTEMARAAPSTCRLCGFYVPLAGALRASYGVCANALGADGHVVHAEYGCGAHSDTELPTGGGSPLHEAYDDAAVELVSPEELRKPSAGTPDDAVEAVAVTREDDRPPATESAEQAGTASASAVVSESATAPVADAPETAYPSADVTAPETATSEASEPHADSMSSAVPERSSEGSSIEDAASSDTRTAGEPRADQPETAADIATSAAAAGESAQASAPSVSADRPASTGRPEAENPAAALTEYSSAAAGAADEPRPGPADIAASGAGESASVAGATAPAAELHEEAAAGAGSAAETADVTAESSVDAEVSVSGGGGSTSATAETAIGRTFGESAPGAESSAATGESGSAGAIVSGTGESAVAQESVGSSAVEGSAGISFAGDPVVVESVSSGKGGGDQAAPVAGGAPADYADACGEGRAAGSVSEIDAGAEDAANEAVEDRSTTSGAAAVTGGDASAAAADSGASPDSGVAEGVSGADDAAADSGAPGGVEYHDAWVVSAVRVRHDAGGASGAAEPS